MPLLDDITFNLNSHVDMIGILATIIGIISFIPVIYGVYQTKKTNNFPYKMLLLALISNILWIIYGSLIGAFSTKLAGAMYFSIYAFILFIKTTS